MSRRNHKRNKVLCRHVGKKIKELRTKANISQEILAFEAKISSAYLGNIERAESDMTLSTALNVFKALNVKMSEFFKLIER